MEVQDIYTAAAGVKTQKAISKFVAYPNPQNLSAWSVDKLSLQVGLKYCIGILLMLVTINQ